MIITVNGVETEVDDTMTVARLVAAATPGADTSRGVAVALDHAVVPRSRWAETALSADARVEIVTAVQGG